MATSDDSDSEQSVSGSDEETTSSSASSDVSVVLPPRKKAKKALKMPKKKRVKADKQKLKKQHGGQTRRKCDRQVDSDDAESDSDDADSSLAESCDDADDGGELRDLLAPQDGGAGAADGFEAMLDRMAADLEGPTVTGTFWQFDIV
jgi:hypothetical protein